MESLGRLTAEFERGPERELFNYLVFVWFSAFTPAQTVLPASQDKLSEQGKVVGRSVILCSAGAFCRGVGRPVFFFSTGNLHVGKEFRQKVDDFEVFIYVDSVLPLIVSRNN
jgi:hypothetical protein